MGKSSRIATHHDDADHEAKRAALELAIRAIEDAIEDDPDNMQLLRDLAHLHQEHAKAVSAAAQAKMASLAADAMSVAGAAVRQNSAARATDDAASSEQDSEQQDSEQEQGEELELEPELKVELDESKTLKKADEEELKANVGAAQCVDAATQHTAAALKQQSDAQAALGVAAAVPATGMNTCGAVIWSWEDDSNSWTPFSSVLQSQLEAAHTGGKQTVPVDGQRHVDVVAMKQICKDDPSRFAVRRVVAADDDAEQSSGGAGGAVGAAAGAAVAGVSYYSLVALGASPFFALTGVCVPPLAVGTGVVLAGGAIGSTLSTSEGMHPPSGPAAARADSHLTSTRDEYAPHRVTAHQ